MPHLSANQWKLATSMVTNGENFTRGIFIIFMLHTGQLVPTYGFSSIFPILHSPPPQRQSEMNYIPNLP